MNPTKSLILLVEDNPLNRQLVRDILIYRGHEVMEAATVSEAKLKLEQAKPDLVLLDIQLQSPPSRCLAMWLAFGSSDSTPISASQSIRASSPPKYRR